MRTFVTILSAVAILSPVAMAETSKEIADPIVFDGVTYDSWQAYAESDAFVSGGRRCGTVAVEPDESAILDQADCSANLTNPLPIYDPGSVHVINVVVHVITQVGGGGNVTDAKVISQIDIMNEDFNAIPGTNGENGTYAGIQFQLATVDPMGNPTNGITRDANNTWFNDGGSYWNTLAWDPDHYLNIYTNNAGGNLGYVPFLPASSPGSIGSNADRVVCLWSAFGRNAPFGPPYNQGRTATHEVGHFLGLYHVFQGGCGTQTMPGCYSSGDRICDTNGDSTAHFGCPNTATCGTPDPIDNYMEYTDDLCMEKFTPEQVRRIRCTLESYRSDLIVPGPMAVQDIRSSSSFTLLQNRPNPFGGATELSFSLPQPTSVKLQVLDVAGRAIKTVTDGQWSAGRHDFTWDGTDEGGNAVASGVYFYRLQANGQDETKRMTLTR